MFFNHKIWGLQIFVKRQITWIKTITLEWTELKCFQTVSSENSDYGIGHINHYFQQASMSDLTAAPQTQTINDTHSYAGKCDILGV